MKTIGLVFMGALLMNSCQEQNTGNTRQTDFETEIMAGESVSVQLPSSVAELFYTMNGISYSALCVFYGHSGVCHVVSDIGACWYDVFYSEYDNYVAYSISNPTMRGWVSGVCYFTPNGYFIEVQGFRYPLRSRIVPRQEWQSVMERYDFD